MNRTSRDRRADGHTSVELLVPEHGPDKADRRMRDLVEDADFEVVGSDRLSLTAFEGSSKLGEGHLPHRFRESRNFEIGERLSLFGKMAAPGAKPISAPAAGTAVPVFALVLCLAAGTAFWMAGGHALFLQSPAPTMMVDETAPLAMPSLIGTAASRIAQTATSQQAVSPPQVISVPRSPRIERAGSILMIRSGG